MHVHRTLITITCILIISVSTFAQQSDKEQLERAIEYFQSSKYHESKLMLQQLNSKYNLNPRFKAFLGVCYYYDSEYENSANLLETIIPKLSAFSPQEQYIYNWLCGESLFELHQWQKAIGYYEASTLMCNTSEKADALYRIGFCYINQNNITEAKDYWESALTYYEKEKNTKDKARIEQLRNMIAAINRNYKK